MTEGNVRSTFWQKTLESFAEKKVKLRMRNLDLVVGEFQEIGPTSAVLLFDEGTTRVINYSDLLEVEKA